MSDNGDQQNRQVKGPVILCTIFAAVIIFGVTLVLDLLVSERIQLSWMWVVPLVVSGGIAEGLRQYPEFAEDLMRRLRQVLAPVWRRARRWPAAIVAGMRARVSGLRSVGRWWSPVTYVVLGAVAAAVTWSVSPQVWPGPESDGDGPCGPSLELRVLVPPEDEGAFQTAADEFAAAQTGSNDCRLVHITVFSSTFYDIKHAFQRGWRGAESVQGAVVTLMPGPQPDIWVAGSTAVVDSVRDLVPEEVKLEHRRSVATSPLVLAVPDPKGVQDHLAGVTAPTWNQLVWAAGQFGLRLARPDPDLSEAGMLATSDLYRGLPEEGPKRAKARMDLERKVASVGVPLSSVNGLLCWIRRQADERRAIIVPERALREYNTGNPLGGECARPVAQPRVPFHALYPRDVSTLNYPFVRVTWRSQAKRDRDEMIDRFGEWLAKEGLRGRGYRDLAGRLPSEGAPVDEPRVTPRGSTTEEVMRALAEYPQGRPAVTAAYVVDVSGSMDKPTLEGISRLDRARDLATQALGLLGSPDSIGLWSFPARGAANDRGVKERVGRQSVNDEHREAMARALAGLEKAEGGSTPLYDAIADVGMRLAGRGQNPAIIVFSDGGNRVRGGIDVARLRASLARTPGKLQVVIMAIGEKECDEPALKALTGDSTIAATCYGATRGETARLISNIFAEIRSAQDKE